MRTAVSAELDGNYKKFLIVKKLNDVTMKKAEELFERYKQKGVIRNSKFKGDCWEMTDEKSIRRISFEIPETAYHSNARQWTGCSPECYVEVVKAYTVFMLGANSLQSVSEASRGLINAAAMTKEELMSSGVNGYRLKDFLEILPEESPVIDEMIEALEERYMPSGHRQQRGKQRTLAESGTINSTLSSKYDLLKYVIDKKLEKDFSKAEKELWKTYESYLDIGTETIGYIFDLYESMFVYQTANKDNLNAIKIVYNDDSNDLKKAADETYTTYKNKLSVFMDWSKETMKKSAVHLVPKVISKKISPYVAVMDLFSGFTKVIGFEKVYQGIGTLPLRVIMQEDGLQSFYMQTRGKLQGTYDQNKNIRLSLIFYLSMARDNYDTMRAATKFYSMNAKYYQGKVEEIEKLLVKLYQCADVSEYDCIDNVKDAQKTAKDNLKNLVGKESDNSEALEGYRDFLEKLSQESTDVYVYTGYHRNYLLVKKLSWKDTGSYLNFHMDM